MWARIYFIYGGKSMQHQKLVTVGSCAKPCSHCTASMAELGFCPCTCV